MADQNQDGLTGWRKIQGNWVVEIGGRVARREGAGDSCLRRPRTIQGCRADDDDDNSILSCSGRGLSIRTNMQRRP